jgi:hypothetical protein
LSFNHFAMSSIAQMPLWVDKSMHLASQIFHSSPRELLPIQRGDESLARVTQQLLAKLAT